MRINSDLVSDFQRDGVVVLRDLINTAALDKLAKGVEDNMSTPGPWANEYTPVGSAGRFFDDYVNWQRIPEFEEVATTGAVPAAALALMKTREARFFHDHVLVKEADTTEVTPWHHDDPYYGIDGIDNVSIWIPLDPISEEIALSFIVGSHLWNKRFIPRRFADQSEYVDFATDFVHLPLAAELAKNPIMSCPVQPGDAIAFHFRTLHCAPGTAGHNVKRRRAVSFRYVGDDARWATRPWRTSPPLDGNGLQPGDVLDDPRFPVVATA